MTHIYGPISVEKEKEKGWIILEIGRRRRRSSKASSYHPNILQINHKRPHLYGQTKENQGEYYNEFSALNMKYENDEQLKKKIIEG